LLISPFIKKYVIVGTMHNVTSNPCADDWLVRNLPTLEVLISLTGHNADSIPIKFKDIAFIDQTPPITIAIR
jgi:hypothetical protein